MIIHGTRVSKIKTANQYGVYCPTCKSSDGACIAAYIKYAHLFWVPAFPIPEYCVSFCLSCLRETKEGLMPNELKVIADDLKQKTNYPWWMFCWPVFVVIIFAKAIIFRE